jgi:D-glycero-D-manno-heptose 1,7-bisphosphate phosphatase
VFLDRDGVVNDVVWRDGTPVAPLSSAALVIAPDVRHQIGRLHRTGWETVVVTNQPDVARGALSPSVLAAINTAMTEQTGIRHVYACIHDGAENCPCRKPRPGMLLDAARDLDLDLTASWLVGDRWVDIAAGNAAGVRSILMERDYSWASTSSGAPPADLEPARRVTSLAAAVDAIIAS